MIPLLLLFLSSPAAAGLDGQFAEIAKTGQGKVGVSAMLLETGEMFAFHGSDHFPMQSVYKFPIAMAVLEQVDRGKLKLEQAVPVAKSDLVPKELHSPIRDQFPEGTSLTIRELVRYAVAESDGTASDVLLRVVGGPASVTKYLRGLGIGGVMVETTEVEMAKGPMVQYRNWATPDSMVLLLRMFSTGLKLSVASRELLEDFMATSTPGPNRIKGLLPAGTRVAHKTGTSGTTGKLTRATNDVGIVTLPGGRHMAIAVFVSDSTAATEVREKLIAEMAKAAWEKWSK